MAPTWVGRLPILLVCAAVIAFAAWQRVVAARLQTQTRSPAWVHVKSPLFRIGNPMVLIASTSVAIQSVIGLIWEYQDGLIAGTAHLAYALFGAVSSTAEGCVVFAVEFVVFRYAQRFVRFRQPTSAFKMKPPRWLRPLQVLFAF